MTNHIVISGTGRAGTSFLVQMLTELGLDTGYMPDGIKLHPDSRAGLEHDMRNATRLPYIVKDPRFCDYCEEIFSKDKFHVSLVIIPVRKLEDAAESRRSIYHLNQKINPKKSTHGGGLFNTTDPDKQEEALAISFFNLIEKCTKYDVAMLFISYPLMLTDPEYLLYKFKQFSYPDRWTGDFFTAHARLLQRDWIK